MDKGKINNFSNSERSDFSDFNCHWWYGAPVSSHSHDDYYEISLVTDGEILNIVNGEFFKQSVGDVILIKPGVTHRIDSIGNSVSKHYNIAITRRYFEGFIQNKKYIKNLLEIKDAIFIHLKEEFYNFIKDVIDRIDNANYNSLNFTLVETVLYTIISAIMLSESSDEQSLTKITHFCQDAITKINNYSYTTLQATEIYKLYPVSHTAFISEFKKLTGKTLVSYLQSKKLDYAKRLLLTTDYSVLEISSLLNYDSLSYFIRIFKDEYNLTPFQYRKNNIGEIHNPQKG